MIGWLVSQFIDYIDWVFGWLIDWLIARLHGEILWALVVSKEPVMNVEEEEECWEDDYTECIKHSRMFQDPGHSSLNKAY